MDYYDKYLKYKLKYLALKENFSGGAGSGIFGIDDELYKNDFLHAIFLINIFHILFFMIFGIKEISKDLYDFDGELENCLNLDGSRTFRKEYLDAYKLLISNISGSHFRFETSGKAIRPGGNKLEILHFFKVNGTYPHFSDDIDYLAKTHLDYHYTPAISTHINDRSGIIASINQEYKIDSTNDNKIKNIVSHCIGLLLDSDKSVIGISGIIKRAISFVSFGNKFKLFKISFFEELVNSIFMSPLPFLETRVDGLAHKKELILLIKQLLPKSASKAEIDELNNKFAEAKLEYQNLCNFTTITRTLNFDFKRDSPFFNEILKGLNKLLCRSGDPGTFENPFESLPLVKFTLFNASLSPSMEADAQAFKSEAAKKRDADEAYQRKLKEEAEAARKKAENESTAAIKAARSGHAVRKAMTVVFVLSEYINEEINIIDEETLINETRKIIKNIIRKNSVGKELTKEQNTKMDGFLSLIKKNFFRKPSDLIGQRKKRLEILENLKNDLKEEKKLKIPHFVPYTGINNNISTLIGDEKDKLKEYLGRIF